MDPQLQSVLTSVGMALAMSIAGYAASKGVISSGDQSNLANALVTVGGVIVTAGGVIVTGVLGWLKMRQVSQKAMIQAVNKADNGVTVVPTTAASAAAQVNAPLK